MCKHISSSLAPSLLFRSIIMLIQLEVSYWELELYILDAKPALPLTNLKLYTIGSPEGFPISIEQAATLTYIIQQNTTTKVPLVGLVNTYDSEY